jgi:hypothetical protein
MELGKLEKYKSVYKDFKAGIESLQSFLKTTIQAPGGNAAIITPFAVSQKLDIPELDAVFLLSLAEKEHILNRVYKVFSDDNTFLGEFGDNKKIPSRITNEETGKPVYKDNFYVDLVFEFEK